MYECERVLYGSNRFEYLDCVSFEGVNLGVTCVSHISLQFAFALTSTSDGVTVAAVLQEKLYLRNST